MHTPIKQRTRAMRLALVPKMFVAHYTVARRYVGRAASARIAMAFVRSHLASL